MQDKIVALIDCDSFYVSCERVFDPSARNKPAVVLSNNDGCIVSACPKAKSIGAKTGVPYFEIKRELELINGVAFSANYTLYGDFSARFVHYVLEEFSDVEIYSVDEVFIEIRSSNHRATEDKLFNLRKKILKEIGISVSVGISKTKTLAKIATKFAKKNKRRTFSLLDDNEINNTLSTFQVEDVWGIGSASATKLKIFNIKTASQLASAENALIKKLLTIVGRRIQDELNGVPSIDFKLNPKEKQEITTSRSFLKPVYEIEDVEKALSDHVFLATDKLRKSGQKCLHMYIFLISNHFKDIPQCYLNANIPLSRAEDDPLKLITIALENLRKIFKWGYEFRKCGVILSDLRPANEFQLSLFDSPDLVDTNNKRTKIIDEINKKFGTRTIRSMACSEHVELPNKAKRSKAYTTDINQLLLVNIDL